MLSVCTDECIVGMIKKVEYALMQRHSCAKNCSDNRLFFQHRYVCNSQWCGNLAHLILHHLAHFISENFSHAFKVSSEPHSVFLNVHISDFAEVLIDDGAVMTEIVNHVVC